jgi:hypothetical protein
MTETAFNSRYHFTTEKPPENFSKTYEAFLYNRETFRNMQAPEEQQLSFYLLKPSKHAVRAEVNFVLKDGEAISGMYSPFGSLCFDHLMRTEVLYAFVDFILKTLVEKGIGSVKIKSYAAAYAPLQAAVLMNVLINKGFLISEAPLNYHMPVSRQPFEKMISKMERRQLNKGLSQGWSYQEEEPEQLSEVYDFILRCRKEREQELNISLEKLRQSFETFPYQYRIFSLRESERLVAATVMVRAGKLFWYNFLPATDPAYYPFSPMVLLLEKLYNFCQRREDKMLDLGIAEVQHAPQFGLMDFKQRMGAVATVKPVFSLKI